MQCALSSFSLFCKCKLLAWGYMHACMYIYIYIFKIHENNLLHKICFCSFSFLAPWDISIRVCYVATGKFPTGNVMKQRVAEKAIFKGQAH